MAVYHGKITVTTTAQALTAAISGIGTIKFLSLQAAGANSGVVYVGGAKSTPVSTTSYGFRIEIPVSNVPNAPNVLEFPIGSVSLADFEVIGTANDVVHITAVTP
jgi:hypothetical protein